MRTLVALGLIAMTGCKASLDAQLDAIADTPAPDVTPPDAPVTLGPWGNLQALGYAAVADDDPTATGDLLELYFNRAEDIYRMTRASVTGAWSTPAVVTELSSTSAETTPEVSYDGLTMYLASERAGTTGSTDIYMSTRASRSDAWGAPVHVPDLSSTSADGAVTTTDGLVLVMDSARQGSSFLDVFISERATSGDPWPAPMPIANINTGGSAEGNPMLSVDGQTLYFDSNRTGNGELYWTTRTATGSFALPQRIDELASDTASDSDPWVSPDGRTMFFTSNRDGTLRIWQATRSPL